MVWLASSFISSKRCCSVKAEKVLSWKNNKFQIQAAWRNESLQNMYLELTESLQMHSIRKFMKLCKISAIKSESKWQSVNFSSFRHFSLRFCLVCIFLIHKAPSALKKFSIINFEHKIHNAKTEFLNWLKISGNYI